MALLEIGLFFFVLLGSKILLGAVAVYMLLPQDPRCVICDAELLPIETPRGVSPVLHALRLQRRWCMECRRETLARRSLASAVRRHVVRPVAQSRLR
jgi:hypothetical protein